MEIVHRLPRDLVNAVSSFVTPESLFDAVKEIDYAFLEAHITPDNVNVYHPYKHYTLLHEAIYFHDAGRRMADIIRLLIKRGANYTLTNSYGRTPAEMYREGMTDIQVPSRWIERVITRWP